MQALERRWLHATEKLLVDRGVMLPKRHDLRRHAQGVRNKRPVIAQCERQVPATPLQPTFPASAIFGDRVDFGDKRQMTCDFCAPWMTQERDTRPRPRVRQSPRGGCREQRIANARDIDDEYGSRWWELKQHRAGQRYNCGSRYVQA